MSYRETQTVSTYRKFTVCAREYPDGSQSLVVAAPKDSPHYGRELKRHKAGNPDYFDNVWGILAGHGFPNIVE